MSRGARPAPPVLLQLIFTSVGASLSDSVSEPLDCPETSSLSSVFILSRPSEDTRNLSHLLSPRLKDVPECTSC